jgi:hypothetical protein
MPHHALVIYYRLYGSKSSAASKKYTFAGKCEIGAGILMALAASPTKTLVLQHFLGA